MPLSVLRIMPLFSSSTPKSIDTKTMLRVIERALRHLPNPEPFRDRLKGAVTITPQGEQEKALRDVYLAAEQELCSLNFEVCPTPAAFRAHCAREFGLQKFTPSSFVVLFLKTDVQIFFLFQVLLLQMLARHGSTVSNLATIMKELGRGTPLERAEVRKDGFNWKAAQAGFGAFPQGERERRMVEAFTRIVHKLYQMLVQKLGQERATLPMTELFKQLKREYGATNVFHLLVTSIPAGVLGESIVEFYPKERLVEELRRHMREIEATNAALANEAHQLRESLRALEKARGEMQHMQQAQGEFIRTISHQFRTPLSVIRWQAEIVAELIAQISIPNAEMPQKVMDGIAGINFKAVFLVDVLNRVFDMLAIDSGQMVLNPRPQALWEVIELVQHDRGRDAKLHNVALVFEKADVPLDEVVVDPMQIQKVIDILVANAVQYSPAGATVTLRLKKDAGEKGQSVLHVTVHDKGIGMSEEDLAKLFTKFYRAETATRKSPDGAGIALYVAKRFVELHGGTMWAESPGPGKGSTFHFIIPEKMNP